jgi:hypothetical protein
VFDKRSYQTEWNLPSLLVLNVFTNKEHCENVKACRAEIGGTPRSMLFKAIPILGSWDKHPEPLINLLDDAWHRVGHDALHINQTLMEVSNFPPAAQALSHFQCLAVPYVRLIYPWQFLVAIS